MDYRRRSVYHTGSADGLTMGVAFVIVMAVTLLSIRLESTLLSLFALLLAIPGIASLAAMLLRRRYAGNNYNDAFSSLWMHGITMFVCGNLILGIVLYAYLRFIDPQFLINQTLEAANLYASLGTEDGDHMARLLHSMVDKRLLPTPISFAFSVMWFGAFFGCMLSLAITFLVRLSHPKRIGY